ncbi:MAG: prenyltransferase/squalene oxidase repeat-containing protein [Henriciella sp.]
MTDTDQTLANLRPAIDRILEIQRDDGAIAWFERGPWDPWNHTESAMALTIAREFDAAARAFDYLAETQREDGAWFGEYGNCLPMVDRDFISREPAPAFLDSNFCAYPAVGLAHFLKATDRTQEAQRWWPMVERALDFVISLQRPEGTISWALEAVGTDEDDALLAGNASILKSLECGLFLAEVFGADKPNWRRAQRQLRDALRHSPERFDRRQTGARFAMDWYYPVLAGVFDEYESKLRLEHSWSKFVIDGHGCRCVSDEPWITVAETAELVLALVSANLRTDALKLFSTLLKVRDDQGVFWMGHQIDEDIVWPREQPSWTQAAVVLAADALQGTSPASSVLTRALLKPAAISAGS